MADRLEQEQEQEQQKTPTRSSSSSSSRCLTIHISPLIPILLDSLRIIFFNHPKLYFSLYILTALPLSLLLSSLSISSAPIKARVAHLEWLANVVPIWIESEHVRSEARANVRALFRLKVLHSAPILLFSFLLLVSSVSSTALALRRTHRPTLRATFNAFKLTWLRPLLTCVVNYAAQLVWCLMLDVISTAVGYPTSVAVVVVGVVVEVYLMAVLSLALVVSVVEERAGVESFWAGSGLMKGRRVCGWVLSGLILVGSGCIGREMEGMMDGRDLRVLSGVVDDWTVGMRVGYMGGLVALLGWVVLWSYVVVTVFYFDRRKVNVIAVKEVELRVDNDV